MKKYVNRKDSNGIETVDQFEYNTKEQKQEAKRCCKEYNFADSSASYYLSQRCTKEWGK